MLELSFCERWFRKEKRIIKPIQEEEAKRLDFNGSPYTIVIGNSKSPSCFIERNSDFYGVNFLDHRLRVYLIYSFEEIAIGKLFLTEAIYFGFDDENESTYNSTAYWFCPDGRMTLEKVEYPSQKAQRFEKKVDVSSNWEDKPEFGCYDDLVIVERPVLVKGRWDHPE